MIEKSAGPLSVKYYSIENGVFQYKNILFDIITDASLTANKSVSSKPIVSKGTQSTFSVEGGSTMTYSFTFVRNNPIDFDNTSEDMTKWSNNVWYDEVTKLIDRWQMRTDGCVIRFNADYIYENGGLVDIRPINPNTIMVADKQVYIKNITRTYNANYNTVISGTIDFVVGRMHIATASTVINREQSPYIACSLRPGALSNLQAKTLSQSPDDTFGEIYGINGTLPNIDTLVQVELDYAYKDVQIGGVTRNVPVFTGDARFTVPYLPSLWGTCESQMKMEYEDSYRFTGWVGGVNPTDVTVYVPGNKNTRISIDFTQDPTDPTNAKPILKAMSEMNIYLTAQWEEM